MCIACHDDEPYFNLATEQCIRCDDYDARSHDCPSAMKFNGINVDAGENRLILPPNKTLDDVRKEQGDHICPENKPFLKDGNCLQC